MPKRVHLPDGRIVNFPDTMTPEQIQGAMSKLGGGAPAPATQADQPQPYVNAFGMEASPRAQRAIDKLDDVVLGVPIPIGQALSSVGPGAVSRAWAAAKGVGAQATPVLKYAAAQAALEKAGLPSEVAVPIALLVSGYKRGAKPSVPAKPSAAPAPRVPANATGTQWGHVSPASVAAPPVAAARVSPAALPPVAPMPQAATGVPPSVPTPPAGPKWSLQRIRNEVGLAEKRSQLTLTEAQREQADRLVAQGLAPKHAVQAVAGPSAPAIQTVSPPAAAAPAQAATLKAKLTAAETTEFFRLRKMGKTPTEAYTAIELQRGFARQFGTPSPEAARQAVAARNATGRWPSR